MPPPPETRYASLDAWRGAACLAVVAFHSVYGYAVTFGLRERLATEGGPASAWIAVATGDLWVGVPVFFAISGYCIAASADRALGKPGATGKFLVRRARRIYPPLWAFLILCTFGVAAAPSEWFPAAMEGVGPPVAEIGELKPANWLGMATLTEEWRANLGGPPKRYLLGHLWTLCYEEQFYLVAAALVCVARRRFFAGVAAVTAAVAVTVALGGGRPGVFWDGLWIVFAAGVAAYYRRHRATPFGRRTIDLGLLAVVASGSGGLRSWLAFQPALDSYLAVGAGFALLLGPLDRADGFVARARLFAPLRFCGRICYSLYLVHAPIAVYVGWNCYRLGITDPLGTLLVTLPLGMSLSLVAGWAFHQVVERRFLNASTRPMAARSEAVLPDEKAVLTE